MMETHLTADRIHVMDWTDLQVDTPPAQTSDITLVVSDVRGTGIPGGQLVRRIRSDPELSAVPVLLLAPPAPAATQHTETPTSDEAVETGTTALDITRLRILVEHHLALDESCSKGASRSHRSLATAVRVIVERNLHDATFTVERLAAIIGLSRRHLTRRVKETLGTTPAAYIRQRRLKRAECLLEKKPDTIAHVVDAVGFRSSSAFAKAFRKHMGMTPTAYVDRCAE